MDEGVLREVLALVIKKAGKAEARRVLNIALGRET